MSLDITKEQMTKENHHLHKHEASVAHEDTGPEKDTPKDTRNLILLIGGFIAIVLIIIGVLYFTSQKQGPVTIDGLHEQNLAGELDPEQGYMYNGYSFILYADVWYTQVQKGDILYDVTFNFDPKSVDYIPVEGELTSDFVKDNFIWITFDPLNRNLKYVGVANFGISRSLAVGFGYQLKAACTKNETKACSRAGIVNCGDEGKSVIYLKDAEEARVILAEDCVIVQGQAEELVKAKDRLLLRWYGITEV